MGFLEMFFGSIVLLSGVKNSTLLSPVAYYLGMNLERNWNRFILLSKTYFRSLTA